MLLNDSKIQFENKIASLQAKLSDQQSCYENKVKEFQDLTKDNAKLNEALNTKQKDYQKLNDGTF